MPLGRDPADRHPPPPRVRIARRRSGRTRRGGGSVGLPPLYVDPITLIAFADTDDEFGGYETALLRVANRYTYVGATDYQDFADQFDELTAAQKAGAVMVNIEFPFLAILQRGDSEGVLAAWVTDPNVLTEATRQSVTIDGASTLDDFRALAQACWQDAVDYAVAGGSSYAFHYASRLSVSASNGVPRAGIKAAAPANGLSWWTTGSGSDPVTAYTDMLADNQIGPLATAQNNAPGHGLAVYSFVPNSPEWLAYAGDWTSASAVRKDADGNTLGTDFSATDLPHWVAASIRPQPQLWRDACDDAVTALDLDAADVPDEVVAIVLAPGTEGRRNDFIDYQHWAGLGAKSVSGWLDSEVVPLFTSGDDDDPTFGPPEKVAIWTNATYYFVTQATNQGDANTTALELIANRIRHALEVELFGRDPDPVGDPAPWGSSVMATQDAWYLANSLRDEWWNDGSAGDWWTVAGGSQLPAGTTLDEDSPLAPWLDFTNDIGRTEVLTALRHYISTKMLDAVKAASAAISARTPLTA